VWPWESAEDAVDAHLAEHKNETANRADLIAHVCDEVNVRNFENRQQFSSLEAENKTAVGNAFDFTKQPSVDVDFFLQQQFHQLLQRSTGSALFPNLRTLMANGRLFVQDVVASGKHHLSPAEIFTLFVFCLDSNVQRFCVAAMQPRSTEIKKNGAGAHHDWYPLIYRTHKALQALPPVRVGFVFRGVHKHPPDENRVQAPFRREDVAQMLQDYGKGKEVTWSAFTTCTPSLHVAASWALTDEDRRGRLKTKAVATVAGGSVVQIQVVDGGKGHKKHDPPPVTIVGDGHGADAVAVVNHAGVVTHVNLTSGGTGYTKSTAEFGSHGFGVIFKIRCKRRARDVHDFSLTPWQKEVIFLNDTRFKVVRHVTFDDAIADLHLASHRCELLGGKAVDTSFIKPDEHDAQNLADVSAHSPRGRGPRDASVMVIELEELV